MSDGRAAVPDLEMDLVATRERVPEREFIKDLVRPHRQDDSLFFCISDSDHE